MSSRRPAPAEGLRETARDLRRRLLDNLGMPISQSPSATVAAQPPIPAPNTGLATSLDIQPQQVHRESIGKDVVWASLEAALLGLEKCSGLLPPLKPMIGMLLNCFKELSGSKKCRQEYQELASALASMVDSMSEHYKKPVSAKMSQCVSNFIFHIEREISSINHQQQKPRLSRVGGASQDEDDLIRCYRHIETCFRQLQVNTNLGLWSIMNEQVANARLDRLYPAMEARYNSAQSKDIRRRRCNPNTRGDVRATLHNWSNSTDSPRVYWLNGMAGTGKTTIAYSLCEELETTCQLGASFFCSRLLSDCRDANKIIPTIAYQLADFSDSYRTALCNVLDTNRNISSYDLEKQFDVLVKKPFLKDEQNKEAMPSNVVVVIDALDECSSIDNTKLILDLLFRSAGDLPIKFFVTSRPDPIIFKTVLSQESLVRSIMVLHEIAHSVVQADIETYLSAELSCLNPPPSQSEVGQLAAQADNLFIFAATAVRYICGDGLSVNSHQRLKIMLDTKSNNPTKKHNEIDILYTNILSSVLENQGWETWEAKNMKMVLHTVICMEGDATSESLISLLLLDSDDEVRLALEYFQSVLRVSPTDGRITALHASFPDYVFTQHRAGRFFCDEKEHNKLLTLRCFDIMNKQLRFNICGLTSSHALDKNVSNLTALVDKSITPMLFYACRCWGSHIKRTEPSQELRSALHEFLSQKLLFWMEVLNLKGDNNAGVRSLKRAIGWSEQHKVWPEIWLFLTEAHVFLDRFQTNLVSGSTPHIYISALPLLQKESFLSAHYLKRFRGLMKVDELVARKASPTRTKGVESVPYFIIGSHVDAICSDCKTGYHHSQKNELAERVLTGHNTSITSLAFSPDGLLIVSSSSDSTICVWDALTGASVAGPFEVHGGFISSVALSSDNSRIVSSSYYTICVRDASTGTAVAKSFEGVDSPISSLAFSSDDNFIISSCDNGTIHLWDAETGTDRSRLFETRRISNRSSLCPRHNSCAPPGVSNIIWDSNERPYNTCLPRLFGLEGAAGLTLDNSPVASMSSHDFVRVCTSKLEAVATGPFKGYSGTVTSLHFSRDGSHLLSGFCGCDAGGPGPCCNASEVDSSRDHTQAVTSVSYSPDGSKVAWGSQDHIIRVWNAQKFGPAVWSVKNSGWVTTGPDQRLHFWVPQALRKGLRRPYNSLVICTGGSLQLDFDSVLVGEQWSRCYINVENTNVCVLHQ